MKEFSVTRETIVYSPNLRYVEAEFKGSMLKARRIRIPEKIQKSIEGRDENLERRMLVGLPVFEEKDMQSLKEIDKLREEYRAIKKIYTKRFRGDGLIEVAKIEKFGGEISSINGSLAKAKAEITKELQGHIDKTKNEIKEYYGHRVRENTYRMLEDFLDKEPNAEDLIDGMEIKVKYKDVTFETLNSAEFKDFVRNAFGCEKAYESSRALKETKRAAIPMGNGQSWEINGSMRRRQLVGEGRHGGL